LAQRGGLLLVHLLEELVAVVAHLLRSLQWCTVATNNTGKSK
jgi:hypothetical protein